MTNVGAQAATSGVQRKGKEGMFQQVAERILKDKVAMIGLIGILLIILIAIFAPLITTYTAEDMDLSNINSGPMEGHLFGTDALGRDYFARCIYGARYSLLLGLVSSVLSAVMGIVIGSIAGYYGKWVDVIIMRFCDIIQSIPAMVISIIVALVLGEGYVVAIIALAIGGVSFSIRLTRAQVLSVRTFEYITVAKTINCGPATIMFKHILPNIFSPMLLDCTMKIAQMIQLSAALSVIGLGVQPPTPEWGAMLSAGRNYITNYPHLVIFPGLFIIATTLFINIFGDGLRDALDPRLRN